MKTIEEDTNGPFHSLAALCIPESKSFEINHEVNSSALERDSEDPIIDIQIKKVLEEILKQLPCSQDIIGRVFTAVERERYELAAKFLECIYKVLTDDIGSDEKDAPLFDPDGFGHDDEDVLTPSTLAPIVKEFMHQFQERVISAHRSQVLTSKIKGSILNAFNRTEKDMEST